MNLPLVPKTQTIVVSQDRCKIFEALEGTEKYFIPTPLDDKVDEFVVSVQDAGGAVVSTTFAAGNDNIIAVISWLDKDQVNTITTKSAIQTPLLNLKQ